MSLQKFDATVLNKECVEKIKTILPQYTEFLQEVEKIREAQYENPEMPLGQAEQFLLSLSEIECLHERLNLWLFMMDWQTVEKVKDCMELDQMSTMP